MRRVLTGMSAWWQSGGECQHCLTYRRVRVTRRPIVAPLYTGGDDVVWYVCDACDSPDDGSIPTWYLTDNERPKS